MKIDHITFSKTGGAGIVVQALAKAQRALGHDVNVITLIDSDLRSKPLAKPAVTLAAAADRWLVASHAEETLFSPLRGRLQALDPESIRPDSIIHLHWVSGVLGSQSLKALLDAGRKVVWTMHDMNPFTGGCHHSHDCQQFVSNCSDCPQARSVFRKTVSVNLERKQLTRTYSNLRVVSPSSWMSKQASDSSVFRDQHCVIVPNPINDDFFTNPNRLVARSELGVVEDEFVSVVIAKDLQDPNKNLPFVIQALEEVSVFTGSPMTLLLVGQNGGSYSSTRLRILWVGELPPSEVASVAISADVVLSASIAESAGMTVVECAALGIPAVALENGGTGSLVENGATGLLGQDLESFAESVAKLISDPKMLSKMAEEAKRASSQYKAELIASNYVELYRSMD